MALEWKNNKDNYNFKGIQIVTNKKWGPQETDGKCSMDDFISKVFPCLQDNYNYTSAKPNEQKAIEWYRENLEINLDSNEAACFTKIFSFRKESCLFGRIEESLVEKCYKEILNLTHNGESQRGYKPALAQYDMPDRIPQS